MVHTVWKKRVFAAVMSVAMLGTSIAATPIVWAAGNEISVNKTLEVAIANPTDPDTPTNKDACTYTGLMSDIFGSGENHTTFTTLQFNFKADEEVTNFSYYFGINLDDTPWWTDLSKECTPYASEFSVVVNVKDLDLKGQNIGYCIDEKWHSDRHLEFQNCYAANGETKIPVTLTSITVNGTSDTSNGTKPVDPSNPDNPGGEDKEAQFPNTGEGGFYSSKNEQSSNYSFVDNKDGTATVKSTITKKLNADDLKKLAKEQYGTDTITLTPSPKGADYSEDGYSDKYGDENSEATVRKNGDPLNSHKFSYDDFGIGSGDETTKITPEALTVVMRAKDNQNVTRIMYGGGLNVNAGSPADTEKAKAKIGRDEAGNVTDDSLAGFKKDGNAGYWYNDIGADNYDDVAKNLENVGYKIGSPDTENGLVQIQNGKDLKEQSFGDYVQVTWDVPEDVKQYADAASGKTISFQLWYGEIEAEEYTPLESLDIDSAMLTYTEELTFPYKSQTKELTINKELKTGDDPLEILYSDLGMTYETTADVYAIEFTLDSKVDARQLVLGNGTTIVDKASDYWYQAGSIALVKSDDKNHEYTYMWIMPTDVANVTLGEGGTIMSLLNKVSTEKEGDHFSIALYYADNNEGKEVTSVNLKSVSAYYDVDNKKNTAKKDLFEKDLSVNPKNMIIKVGDTRKISTNVDGCTFTSEDPTIATVDKDGNVTGVGAGTVVINVETPKGQKDTVNVT
ncbi:MAG: DUF5620 domain-containing protein, partial [Ruminococcus sp.]|nr:DUF5620 domain-containing protein [Ruminococcus sp.]